MDETLHFPFQQDIRPYTGRTLGQFEWVAFEETLSRWSAAIKVAINIQNQRPTNPTSQWARRRRQREQQSTGQGEPQPSRRASGPPLYCKVAEEKMVAHFTAAYAESPPTPDWLFPPQDGEDTDEDVLSEPFSPKEIVRQTNARVPSAWKHSTITLLHKGGEPAELKNWRTVSVQLTVYKLYAAIIAKRIASWATAMSSFSPAQKGFLAYDGCGGVYIFLLRSILGDSRREKNLLLAWLDIKDAFPSVSHHLMLSFMERVGLSGSVLRVVQDIYSHATVAIRTGRESRTPPIPQQRGVKQGCLLSPILFNVVIGLLRHLSASQGGYSIARYNINTLAYADDVCVIASSKTKMQSLLDRPPPRIYVDRLFTPHLGGDIIPALTWAERYRYLGCPTGAFRTRDEDLDSVKEDLLRDTSAIFKSLLAEWQKLDVFCRFLFPRLTFIFQVIFPGPIWCRRLDTKLRGIIKQGLKLPQRTCSQYLYLPQASGGLGVPNAEDEAYVAKAAQAFKFLGDTRDPVIRAVALQQLRATVAMRARSPTNS
ncbi:hypothetical protein EMCRGX_G005438 [Ephydatia muelleri]